MMPLDAGPGSGSIERRLPRRTHSRSASAMQPVGNSACSTNMLGISSLIANRGPHRVQIEHITLPPQGGLAQRAHQERQQIPRSPWAESSVG